VSLPSPQESASMLFDSIKNNLFRSHIGDADVLLTIAQHIEADRAAHCRHVMTLPTAHPNASGPNTPGRAAGVLKKGNKQ